ncbi:hypothetical protein [Photobacterium carnosum]|uniref:hypothetical protein n=1 Tax=Photobacterium carnosum TaxID=2023717 RepID=UPI001E65CACA|nr:hypothetical protein [Photobacterium carnosum]MCD9530447.1 hypothetical protein [Photobacterium carnosum]
MKYNLNEVLNQSIMTKVPTIVLEGIDDISVYDSIMESTNKQYFFIAVENIEGYEPGCDGVINAMNFIDNIPSTKYKLDDYILGIIDKDVKDCRDELPNNKYIFPLKYYSMESHFFCEEIISDLVKFSTKTTRDLRNNKLDKYIFNQIVNNLNNLYFFSIEALKGSLDKEYEAEVSYSFTEGRLNNNTILSNKINDKRNQLIDFAGTKNLQFNNECIKKVVKGKWLLYMFCYEFEQVLKILPNNCLDDHFDSCQFCIAETTSKCLFRMKEGITHKSIRHYAQQNCHVSNFDYIRDKLSTLAS